MRRLGLVAATFFLGATLVRAGDSTETKAPDLVALAENDNQVMQHLDHLTNKIGARLTGSSNLAKAYEWTASEFERFWLKNVHTETWGEYAVGFDRGPSSGKVVSV